MFEKRSDLVRFLTVVSCGQIVRAALVLHMTQPSLTRVIHRLENEAGGPLFDRLSNGVKPTARGTFVADRARHLLREIDLANAEIMQTTGAEARELRLSATSFWTSRLLPSAIARFHGRYPDVSLQLRTASFADAWNLLTSGHIDLHCSVFGSREIDSEHVVQRPLVDLSFGVFAHEAHPLCSKSHVTTTDLAAYPWVSYGNFAPGPIRNDWPMIDTLFDPAELPVGSSMRTLVRSDNLGSQLFVEGNYLTYMPRLFALSARDATFRELPIEREPQSLSAGILYRRSIGEEPVFRHLIDTIETLILDTCVPPGDHVIDPRPGLADVRATCAVT